MKLYTPRDSKIGSCCVGQPPNLCPACIAKLFKFSCFGAGSAWHKFGAPPCHNPIFESLWVYKLLILFLIPCALICSDVDPEEIDEEWLVQPGNCQGAGDYVPHFQTIFQEVKVRTLLQFGIGYETKYFLDHATKVISLEFVNPGYGPDWMKRFLDFYRDFSNWIPIVYFSSYQGDLAWAPFKYIGSEHLYKAAAYQCSTHQDYALNDPFYKIELDAFIGNLVKYNNIDAAFVAPPIYLRGDFIQLLFGKVPLIIAHDTSVRDEGLEDDVYGYSRVETPHDYEEIYLPGGSGTTVWILKTGKYERLAEKLRRVSEQ